MLMRLVVVWLGVGLAVLGYAQDKPAGKTIYKWSQGGLVHYSHLKPENINNVTKLDANGLTIEDFTDGFDEIVAITVRPNIPKSSQSTPSDTPPVAVNNNPDATVPDAEQQKLRNCATARRNLATLKGGEVYEKNNAGSMVRLSPSDIATQLKHVKKDIAYFCSE